MINNTMSLKEQAEEILRIASEHGVEQNFFFITTFQRYQVQLNTLTKLQAELDKGELLVSKEYVKGRKNLVANPAIGEYNKTSTAANQTVTTLMKIIHSMRPVADTKTDDENNDPFINFLKTHSG